MAKNAITRLSATEQAPPKPAKGRGAQSNASGRFEAKRREAFDDGWDRPEDEELPPLRTTVMADSTRSIIARNDSPDIPFDRSINPYRGCEHGCVYCFARPTHAYLGFSAGLDFETKLVAKYRAAELLRRELAKPSYKPETLALGTNTDPYQPLEKKLQITRQVLEVLSETNHPITIVTKSDLVLRDLDILAPMAAKGLARVCLSVTTLDRKLARALEPRAPTPAKRLAAIRALSEAGIPSGVMTAPMIPALNDHELEAILEEARAAGAGTAGYVLLRLPLEIAGLFEEWLEAHAPDRKERVLKLVRETRGGKTYDSTWGKRMKGEGVYAKLLAERFAKACRKYGFNKASWPLDTSAFLRPSSDRNQLSLF
ncbi:MAG: PA0069 family radical SAM protein [Rhodovibrionaceae bacterium]